MTLVPSSLLTRAFSWLLLSGIVLIAPFLAAREDPPPVLLPTPVGDSDRLDALRKGWKLDALEAAISHGFFSVVENLGSELLEAAVTEEEQRRVFNALLQAALVQGKLASAQSSMEQMRAKGMAADPLLAAFLAFFEGRSEISRGELERLKSAGIPRPQQAWAALLDALLLSREGRTELANDRFLEAERLADTALLRDHFEVVRFREELASGNYSEAAVNSLRDSVRSMRGERGGFEAARLLAVALNGQGNRTEAIEVLNNHMAMPSLNETGLRPDFLLLMGMIAGPENPRGRLALRQLVSAAQDPQLAGIALALLGQSSSTPVLRDSLQNDLRTWLAAGDPHPLADRMLAYEAFLSLRNERFGEAETSASALLERYPNSLFRTTALRVLAFTSWAQTPPRYRTAAGYLNQLREELREPRESQEVGVLVADCYFLNEDYSSAADAYRAVLREVSPDFAQEVFFQLVVSEIRAGRAGEAGREIYNAYANPNIETVTLWRAEWNLLDHLRKAGRVEQAFDRLQEHFRREGPGAAVPPTLHLRMRWLLARLLFEVGRNAEALERCNQLLADLGSTRYASIPDSLIQEVESHLLLLKGEILFAEGAAEQALEVFASLRQAFPDSGPTILSYLVESRSESGEENLVSAERSLVDLVDRFPESEYAPIALWEAALTAEQRGLNTHLQEAISRLERLVTEYPEHSLVYFARLKQGDLARRLNDFPTALLLYERLLALYPGHPERFRAEISRADCLMALASDDPTRFDVAAVIYERNCLLPSAPLPVRLESGFKWANALLQQGDPEGSEVVFWLLYERFILDPDMNQRILSEPSGRYWMARVLLEMGNLQVEKGENASAVTLYQTLLGLDLPGSALAESRLQALR